MLTETGARSGEDDFVSLLAPSCNQCYYVSSQVGDLRGHLIDKGCAVRFVDYIARFSTYIVILSTLIGEILQDNPQISSPQT